jgi:hypothetical protein
MSIVPLLRPPRAAPAEPVAPPAPLTGTVLGIDISNHNGELWDEFAAYPDHEHVIVRIPLSVEPAWLYVVAVQQCRQVLAEGRTLGFYVWPYLNVSPLLTIREAVTFARANGFRMPVLWIDEETYHGASFDPGPDAPWLRSAFAECDRLGVRSGHYSAAWWVDGYFPGGFPAFAEFNARPVWVADYNGIPTLDAVGSVWARYGFQVVGHQYRGSPVDLDVFDRSVT